MNKVLVLFTILIISIKWKSYSQSTNVERLCRMSQDSCRDCLLAHHDCSWCSDNNTTSSARCRISNVTEDQCQEGFIQNPRGGIIVKRNDDFTMVTGGNGSTGTSNLTIQLRPQLLDIKLRQGESQKFNLTFRRTTNSPLDLYYVMDLSLSMKDDLQTLQELAINLADDIALPNVTENLHLGFGSFVDKTLMPYVDTVPEKLQNPCQGTEEEFCAPVFGFRHQLSLTSDRRMFESVVNATRVSGNIDQPEGGFDALMQIATCQNEIKWREGALKVIVFTTDASSHIALDGKLAAILKKNDMQCHLNPEQNGMWTYSETTNQDYPSIGQLKKVFKENKIHTIFAVTEDVYPLYQDLEILLDTVSVSVLTNNSDNVVDIIRDQYGLLRNQLKLNPPSFPSNVNLRYRVLCPNKTEPFWVPNSLECENVRTGEEAIFEFEIIPLGCPSDPNRIDTINITSSSIVDPTKLRVQYVSCQCPCFEDRIENSPACNGMGAFECGLCYCSGNVTGQQCQCTGSKDTSDAQCTSDPDNYKPGDVLCNNVGTCVCGNCSCDGDYFGNSCECRRSGCTNECGGPSQGRCENCNDNPVCICREDLGWTLNPLVGDCSCNEARCTSHNSTEVCNGRGTCECNTCVCEEYVSGFYCSQCLHPKCTGITDGCAGLELRRCAECVYEVERQSGTIASACEQVCTQMGLGYNVVDSILDCDACSPDCDACNHFSADRSVYVPELCQSTHVETECEVTYKIFWNTAVQPPRFVVQVLKPDAEKDCPGPFDPLLIVLPVVGSILLLGLLALLLWKILQNLRDKREYELFVEQSANALRTAIGGRYCTQCLHPKCTGITDGCAGLELRRCAECVYEAKKQNETIASACEQVCTQMRLGYEVVDSILDCDACSTDCDACNSLSANRNVHIPELCRSTLVGNECEVTYKIFWNTGVQPPRFLVQVLKPDAEIDCPGPVDPLLVGFTNGPDPGPVDPLLIVLPVVGGILFLGLLALLLWKIFQHLRIKRENEMSVEQSTHGEHQ